MEMKEFVFFSILMLFAFTFGCSVYKLCKVIKLHRIKTENKYLKSRWRSIFYFLIIAPGLFYSSVRFISDNDTIPRTAYEIGYFFGSITGSFIVFFLMAYLLTCFIPWCISLFRRKEISASVLGFFIIILWYPVNIGTLLLAYDAYREIKIGRESREIESIANFDKVLADLKNNPVEILENIYIKYGYNIDEFDEIDDIRKFLEEKMLSLEGAKEFRKGFIGKIERLQSLQGWWIAKIGNLEILNDTIFNKFIEELFSRGEGWDKLSEIQKKHSIDQYKKGFRSGHPAIKKVLKEYNVSSPWEFRLSIYKTAVEMSDLYISTFKVETEKERLQLQSDIDHNIDLINNYIEQENKFQSKMSTS